jgi:hypothetical protein
MALRRCARHHREHVDGDYKHPPPAGRYRGQLRRSREGLKQPPVMLSPAWRPIIGRAIRDRLQELGAFVLCLAVAGQHSLAFAKLPNGASPRKWMGFAKKHAYFEAESRGWLGKLWARRGKEMRVRDRAHQLNVYHYILSHANEGAWVWDWVRNHPEPTDRSPWA